MMASTTKSFTNAVEAIVVAKLLKRLITSEDKLKKYANNGKYDPITKLALSLKKLLRYDAASKMTAIYLAHKQLKEEMQVHETFIENAQQLSAQQIEILEAIANEASYNASNMHLLELVSESEHDKYPILKKYLKVN